MSEAEMNANGTPVADNISKDKEQEVKCRRGREDKRERKKDDKSVEHVLKALNSLETTEEKLAAMCKKYTEVLNDHRTLQNAAKQAEKKCSVLQREKEQLQADHSKAILTRSRLENLCRELQRQNKAVKEENMMRIREEEEKKREVVARFQTKLNEISEMLKQNNDKNTKLRDDNIDMTAKLKNVCEQYEKREQHVEKLAKQMELEMQLADAKLAKAKMEMAVEKEGLLREKQQLLLEKAEYKTRLGEMASTEQALRNQITLYNNKYDEFHRALTQSNEAIGGFKTEMERMSKQIRKLEKETVSWKVRYEQTHTSLLKMTEDKFGTDQELASSQRKLVALQGLCRSLQAQCVQLRQQVKTSTRDNAVEEIKTNGPDTATSDKIKTLNMETVGEKGEKDKTLLLPALQDNASDELKKSVGTMSTNNLIDKTIQSEVAENPITKDSNAANDNKCLSDRSEIIPMEGFIETETCFRACQKNVENGKEDIKSNGEIVTEAIIEEVPQNNFTPLETIQMSSNSQSGSLCKDGEGTKIDRSLQTVDTSDKVNVDQSLITELSHCLDNVAIEEPIGLPQGGVTHVETHECDCSGFVYQNLQLEGGQRDGVPVECKVEVQEKFTERQLNELPLEMREGERSTELVPDKNITLFSTPLPSNKHH